MSTSNECPLNNALEEDFQKNLRPYNVIDKLLCASKYRIKDNFVFPNSKVYCAFNFIVPCFVMCIYISDGLAMSCTLMHRCPLIADIQYLFGLFVASACMIFKRQASVKLLIRMQDIDRKLKCFGITNLTYFVLKNWCLVVSILVFYVLEIFFISRNNNILLWTTYVAWFLLINLDLNILFGTCIVEFLSSRLRHFSRLLKTHNENYPDMSVDNNLFARFKNITILHKEILQAFREASSLTQYWVLANIIATFIDSLITVQILIELSNDPKGYSIYGNLLLAYVLSSLWYMKNWGLVVIFSVACEKYYTTIDDMKSVCVDVLELHPEQTEYQKTAKNILRLCDVSHSKIRLCGLFTVDAALPLRLLGLVATYSIVLLQFAFL